MRVDVQGEVDGDADNSEGRDCLPSRVVRRGISARSKAANSEEMELIITSDLGAATADGEGEKMPRGGQGDDLENDSNEHESGHDLSVSD